MKNMWHCSYACHDILLISSSRKVQPFWATCTSMPVLWSIKFIVLVHIIKLLVVMTLMYDLHFYFSGVEYYLPRC